VTTLTHTISDNSGKPIAGRKTQVAVYLSGPDGPEPGTFKKVDVVNAISDKDGKVSWELPKYPGKGAPTYVVTGIENYPVVVRIPAGLSTVQVNAARIAVLTDTTPGTNIDLVTEDELIAKLNDLLNNQPPPPAPGGGGGVTPLDHMSAHKLPSGDTFCILTHVLPADLQDGDAFDLTGHWPSPYFPLSNDIKAVFSIQTYVTDPVPTQNRVEWRHGVDVLPKTGSLGDFNYEIHDDTDHLNFHITLSNPTSFFGGGPIPAGTVVEVSVVFAGPPL
jgi:hypothetical protein